MKKSKYKKYILYFALLLLLVACAQVIQKMAENMLKQTEKKNKIIIIEE